MKIFLLIFTLLLPLWLFAQVNPNSVYVNGYYRSNGTYVQPHYRTAPNNTINDNYTTRPNVNPYTGKAGTIAPETYSGNSYEYRASDNYNSYQNRDSYSLPTSDYKSQYEREAPYIPYKTYSNYTTNSTDGALITGLGFGRMTFYTDCSDCGNIKIYLDNAYVGTLSQYFSQGKPSCGASGTIVIDKAAGNYRMTAKGVNWYWEGTITIPRDKCEMLRLHK